MVKEGDFWWRTGYVYLYISRYTIAISRSCRSLIVKHPSSLFLRLTRTIYGEQDFGELSRVTARRPVIVSASAPIA